jgi:peptidylprolyl isomerase
MTNGLQVSPQTVACPSTTLCVFAGESTTSKTVAVEASQGPFTPGGRVVGHPVTIPQAFDDSWGNWADPHLSCPSVTLCVLSTPDANYATSSPLTGPWVLELADSSDISGDITCPDVDFCAAILFPNGVMISTQPLGGARTWSRTELDSQDNVCSKVGCSNDVSLSAIACPSPRLCIVGGNRGGSGGESWIETSSDPIGGSSTWSRGSPPVKPVGSGRGGYAVAPLGCPTTGFCVAAVNGQLGVSDDPAGGFQTWHAIPTGEADGNEDEGVAWCTPGKCAVSDVGTFPSVTAESSPVVSYNSESESCVSLAFCVAIDDEAITTTLEVGRVAPANVPWPPPIASIAHPTAAGRFGTRPPRITVGPQYPEPIVLEKSDLIKGKRAAVKAGDRVTVQEVDVDYSSPGKVAYTTWTHMPATFTVGRDEIQVGPGLDEGVVGMKVGGRRELIIPNDLDPAASGDMVLVIDLLRIR